MIKQKTIIISVLTAMIISLCSCGQLSLKAKTQINDFAMGSDITLCVYHADFNGTEITKAIHDLDNSISKNIEGSEVSVLNSANGEQCFSPVTCKILKKTLPVCKITGNKFNPLCGTLTNIWNFDTLQTLPDKETVTDAAGPCDINNLKIENEKITLLNGAMLDLGAVGKGAACDVAIEKSANTPAVISVGGSVGTNLSKPDGTAWVVSVKDPFETNESACTFEFYGTKFISTSGSYEKYKVFDGKTYHHIIDTSTGYPFETNIVSATAICSNGALSDALSTGLFASKIDDAEKICNEFGAYFIIIDNQNNIYISNEIKTDVKSINQRYNIIYV